MMQGEVSLRMSAGSDVLQSIPRRLVEEIEEPAARNMMEALQAQPIELSGVGTVASTFVGPAAQSTGGGMAKDRVQSPQVRLNIYANRLNMSNLQRVYLLPHLILTFNMA